VGLLRCKVGSLPTSLPTFPGLGSKVGKVGKVGSNWLPISDFWGNVEVNKATSGVSCKASAMLMQAWWSSLYRLNAELVSNEERCLIGDVNTYKRLAAETVDRLLRCFCNYEL
jgi:hypothetical protein